MIEATLALSEGGWIAIVSIVVAASITVGGAFIRLLWRTAILVSKTGETQSDQHKVLENIASRLEALATRMEGQERRLARVEAHMAKHYGS